jgi:hypothetical protein
MSSLLIFLLMPGLIILNDLIPTSEIRVKSISHFFPLVLLIGILTACSQNQVPATIPTNTSAPSLPVVAVTPSIDEPLNACDNFFLPLQPSTTWLYSDGTALSASSFEGNDSEGSINIIKLNPDGSLEKQYIQCTNGKLEIVKVGTLDKNFNETGAKTINEISNGSCDSRIILPEVKNLIPGKTWQQCTTACRVVNDQTIVIQLGTFKTRRVECEDGTVRWYAPQFGMIKTCTGKECSELISLRAPN